MELHDIIFEYIDRQLCHSQFNYDYHIKNKYFLICITSSLIDPGNKGIYQNGKIWIHRFNLNKPNVSYMEEIVLVLHEYGHHISLNRGDKVSVTEVGFIYKSNTLDNPRKIILKEELNAWKHAILTIKRLPVSWFNKIKIAANIFRYAPKFFSSYLKIK